jgi:hypothetical protein
MEHQVYRCCLPTLAGFTSNHCIGPGLRRRPAVYSPTPSPRRGIRPSYSGLLDSPELLRGEGTANSPPSTTKLSQKTGADGRDRTDDLRFTKPLLYQLSYIGQIASSLCHVCAAAQVNRDGCGILQEALRNHARGWSAPMTPALEPQRDRATRHSVERLVEPCATRRKLLIRRWAWADQK